MPMLVKTLPVLATYRRYLGAGYVIIGAIAAATVKNKTVKELALIVAGTGVYDLIAMNLTMLGLPAPAVTAAPAGMGASFEMQRGVGASYEPSSLAGDDSPYPELE
jgi:hypothetical protein